MRAEFTSFIRVPSVDLNCLMGGSGDCMSRLFREHSQLNWKKLKIIFSPPKTRKMPSLWTNLRKKRNNNL
ncbi:hypothetical protein CapIbe_002384 [Capra ibex]